MKAAGVVALRPGRRRRRSGAAPVDGRPRRQARAPPGLAEQVGPAQSTLAKPGLEPAQRDLGIRGDIIKTMHRAVSAADREPDVAGFALHGQESNQPVLGRLVERGLHDELKGSAYAIIDGVDGRTHHLLFADLEMTGDAKPGAIVEARFCDDAGGRKRQSLATRSDLTLEAQVAAARRDLDRPPATRQGLRAQQWRLWWRGQEKPWTGGSTISLNRIWLGSKVHGSSLLVTFSLHSVGAISPPRRPTYRPTRDSLIARPPNGDHVSGVCRQRVTLSSGRFAQWSKTGWGFSSSPGARRWSRSWGQRLTGTHNSTLAAWRRLEPPAQARPGYLIDGWLV